MPPKPHWAVWGLLAGPLLPKVTPRPVGRLTIETVADVSARGVPVGIKRPEVRSTPAPGGSAPSALLSQTLPNLESPWAFNVPVLADTREEAWANAEGYLPTALAALDVLADGPPYRAILTSVTTPTGESTMTSNIVEQKVYEPRELTVEDARRATEVADVVQENPKARAAARLLRNGIDLADAGVGFPSVQAASLLTFFRVIELVVQAFPASDIDAEEYTAWEAQQRPRLFAAEPSNLPKVLREACRDLDRLESTTLGPRIERAGRAWELNEDTIELAQALHRLRSTKLAHPRVDPPSEEELSKWLRGDVPRAYGVSLAYLRAYLESLASEPNSGSEAHDSSCSSSGA